MDFIHLYTLSTFIYIYSTLVLIRDKNKGERKGPGEKKSRKSFQMCDFIYNTYYKSHKSLLSIPYNNYAKSCHTINSYCYP